MKDTDACASHSPARSCAQGERVVGARLVVVSWTSARLVVIAAALLPATLIHAALPTRTEIEPEGVTSLAGQLLVASPQLRQPIFDHAVILLAQHSREGALGIIINRPAAERPVAALLTAAGADASGVSASVRIFIGGPVDPGAGLVLHSAEYKSTGTLAIDSQLALTGTPDVLRDIGLGKGPSKSIVAFGYSGWAPLQLESEVAQGVWITVPEDPVLVFDEDRSKVWADAYARRKTLP
jgi:putative transcriptional regulator